MICPLTMKMTEWIRRRAASEQGLNIHEVLRERPDLIREAYLLPKPLGWRRCLMEAGVDPYKIVHTHEEVVECVICGHTSSVLGGHLKISHNIDSGKEYRQEYGADLKLSSESYRIQRSRFYPVAGIRHWEHLWSSYYIIDWIIRLKEEGHSLNFSSVKNANKSLANEGWSIFGSWDEALIAAGFNPDKERAKPPDKHWDMEMLRARLHQYAVEKRAKRISKMPIDLIMAAKHHCGNLEAAALEPV
jgi:hypothetical protein